MVLNLAARIVAGSNLATTLSTLGPTVLVVVGAGEGRVEGSVDDVVAPAAIELGSSVGRLLEPQEAKIKARTAAEDAMPAIPRIGA